MGVFLFLEHMHECSLLRCFLKRKALHELCCARVSIDPPLLVFISSLLVGNHRFFFSFPFLLFLLRTGRSDKLPSVCSLF